MNIVEIPATGKPTRADLASYGNMIAVLCVNIVKYNLSPMWPGFDFGKPDVG